MSLRFTDTSESQTAIQGFEHHDSADPSQIPWTQHDPQGNSSGQQCLTTSEPQASQSNHFNFLSLSGERPPPFLEPIERGSNEIFSDDYIQYPSECDEMPDSIIDVCMLLTLPDADCNPVWSYLNFVINVTQNYVKTPSDTSPPPQNSAQTSQKIIPHGASDGRHMKEITMRIIIKNTSHTRYRLYQFQLVCVVFEDDSIRSKVDVPWKKIEVCTIVKNRCTNQLLRPQTRDLLRRDILRHGGDDSLGAFAYDGMFLYHIGSTIASQRRGEIAELSDRIAAPIRCRGDRVITVEKSDRVVETRKARAGRPSHRLTGELLMTRHQVEKVIEIRERWRGLTARQRRTHVKEADFYPLLTLNRDEAARVLNVCTTWFKDIIRLQGITTWPGRPLRRSGADLEELKENLASAKAAMQFVQPHTPSYKRQQEKIHSIEGKINAKLQDRLKVVRGLVSEAYFERYARENGYQYLNPDWDTLPLPSQGPHDR